MDDFDNDSDEYVLISIKDTGMGVPDEFISKIMEPFYTTKILGRGTGLGLSMVYGFIQRSRGHINIQSKISIGTTIELYVPKTNNSIIDAITLDDTNIPTGEKTILIVDNEHHLTEVCGNYLQELGYNTILATSGNEALNKLKMDPSIDLLFSDILMPEMNGYELALESHDFNPDLKIQLTTGHNKLDDDKSYATNIFLESLKKNILKKPYPLKELAIKIRSVLDDIG